MPATYNKQSSYSAMIRGLLTAAKVNVLGTSTMLWTVNYYDDEGRVVKAFSDHYKGGTLTTGNYDEITNSYTFTNELKSSTRIYKVSGKSDISILTEYDYDHEGRKLNSWETINSGTRTLLSHLNYNAVGQLSNKKLHSINSGASFLQSTSYTYNERGWLTESSAPLLDLKLRYNQPVKGGLAQYNGNISEQEYTAAHSGNDWVTYSYDRLNRLTAGTSSEGYSETGISYDKMGNIKTLTRNNYGTLTYTYSNSNQSNQLASIAGFKAGSFGYDANGNVKTDGTRSISSITYNYLNLPQSITGPTSSTYTYDATGRKLRKVVGTSSTDYIGGIQYDNGVLSFIQTEEGRAIPSGTTFNYEYTLTDHLGNNRVAFFTSTGTAVQVGEEAYYPFGLNVHKQTNSPENNYLYNKKELQEDLTQYDYGARFYDPVVGRWTRIDNKAEAFESISPYIYAVNDPVNAIDPDGNLVIFVNGFVPGQFINQDNRRYVNTYQGNTHNDGFRITSNSHYRPYPGDRDFHSGSPSYLGQSFDYWGSVDDTFEKGYSDNHALYVSASSQNTSEASDRFAEGETAGNNLISQLDAGTISLADGETIKIVSHSQGGAFAAGLSTVLSKSKKYASVLQQVVYLEPHQPADFNHPANVDATQISSPDDRVASGWNFFSFLKGKTSYSKINGVNHFITNNTHKGDATGGHSVGSNLDEIANYFRSLGIPVTVQ